MNAAATVPGGMYPNNPDDIASWGPKATFVTAASTSDEVVYALVSAVFDNIDSFKKIVDFITTRSDVFTIRCVATADRNDFAGATLETDAVVDRSSTPCKILYWYQGTSN